MLNFKEVIVFTLIIPVRRCARSLHLRSKKGTSDDEPWPLRLCRRHGGDPMIRALPFWIVLLDNIGSHSGRDGLVLHRRRRPHLLRAAALRHGV